MWSPMRTKRDVSDKTAEPSQGDDAKQEEETKIGLEHIIEDEISADQQEDEDNVDKRDASADASRLEPAHVLPPPHDVHPC